jgi:hypothetical protein
MNMAKTFTHFVSMFFLLLVGACSVFGNGFKPPGYENEAWTSKQKPSQTEVDRALISCGVIQLSNGLGSDRGENAGAIIQECMFAKGFYRKSGYGGSCATPEFRARIPTCVNAPLRSRDSYFGN